KFSRVEVPLIVDRFDRENLAISGVVLCKRYHMVPDEPREAGQSPQYVPLVSSGLEFTPAGDARFQKNDRLMTYFEIYEPPLGGTGAVKIVFQMRVKDASTGEISTDTGLRPVQLGSRPGNPVIPVAEEIAIDKLPAGTYRLEVQASDSTGKSTIWRGVSFTVE